jgi:protease I
MQARRSRVRLDGMRVAIFAGEGVEDLEYWVTFMRLREEGAAVTSVGLAKGTVHGKNGLAVPVDRPAADVRADEVDALVIPGGWMPDKLRRYPAVTDLAHAVHAAGKPLAIICHGGLIGISAKVVAGGRATGSLGIKDDLVNAGATWVDEPAFRDGTIAWGRVVEDIPAFLHETVELFAEHHARRR